MQIPQIVLIQIVHRVLAKIMEIVQFANQGLI